MSKRAVLILRLVIFLALLLSSILVPLRLAYLPLAAVGLCLLIFPIDLNKYFKKQLLLFLIAFSHIFVFGYFLVNYLFFSGSEFMTTAQLQTVLNLFYRTSLSYLVITFYNTLNSFTEIITTLKLLRTPSLVISLFTLSYRFTCVFIEKSKWLLKSFKLRVYRRHRLKVLLRMVKSMLIKSFLYTNKIAAAMKARNFSPDLDFKKIYDPDK